MHKIALNDDYFICTYKKYKPKSIGKDANLPSRLEVAECFEFGCKAIAEGNQVAENLPVHTAKSSLLSHNIQDTANQSPEISKTLSIFPISRPVSVRATMIF